MENDLISRAAAIEALSTPCDKRYRHGVWETCLDNIETAIRNIPTVDAAPVVHGRWEEKRWTTDYDWGVMNHRAIVCSACDKEIYAGEKTPYCQNCGAKMDGRVANG